MRIFLAFVIVLFVSSAAFAQQQATDAEKFAAQWAGLDASITSLSVQRQNVIDAARALIVAYQKQNSELAAAKQALSCWEKTGKPCESPKVALPQPAPVKP
jgi:putative cell wall-binding protein